MGNLILILAIVGIIVWIYVDINSARATARWLLSGCKGVASDVNGLKAEVKQKQVENPTRQQNIYETLNENVLDLHGYKVAAEARSTKSHEELKELIKTCSADETKTES